MAEMWFKSKSYGYGAAPAKWKGWVATFVFVLLTLAASLMLLPMKPAMPNVAQWVMWAAAMTLVTTGFIVLARARTAGAWKWRNESGDK